MSSNDIVVDVQALSKVYNVYESPEDRLKQSVLTGFRRIFGLKPKQYHKQFWSLKDVSFQVKRGETLGIVGRNGAGKSTLLQIICGTLGPTHGSIQTFGRVAALLELGSGFNPEFTGRENIYLNAAILGLSRKEIDDKYQDIIKFANIGDFIDQSVKTYSSGMLLRVAFAVIAHVEADVLIIDEALAVGDAFFTQKCMRFLRKFMESGTVLFVSHDTSSVVNLCDRAILLQKGEIVKSGDPNTVVKAYLAMQYETEEFDAEKKEETIIKTVVDSTPEVYVDMRQSMINTSNLRNDVEVFKFESPEDDFGTGKAEIEAVHLLDEDGQKLAWAVGGVPVTLEIICQSHTNIMRPIIGFQVRDRLGQVIFADNSYLIYQHATNPVSEGQGICAKFSFLMPILPSGDYSFAVALADGTQEDHIQHHWIFDALIIKVHASQICHGLVGVPMSNIELTVS